MFLSFRAQLASLTLVLALIPIGNAVGDQASDAEFWLGKMSTALREESYHGVFTFMRGTQFNAMEISHIYANGTERERILQLNGERRDIIRVNQEVVCHHDGESKFDLNHDVPMGPFSAAFNEDINRFKGLYNITVDGKGRVADRVTVLLTIMPRHADRFGYRLWLDQETGLLLQSHLIEKSRVKEVFQFAKIEIGDPVPLATLAAATNEHTVSHQLTQNTGDNDEVPTIKVAWLPMGFKPVLVTSNRIHFSDGLATFSVFFARQRQLPDMATQVGGTTVITRKLGNSDQITVIGEVPVETARRVADSVEPILY